MIGLIRPAFFYASIKVAMLFRVKKGVLAIDTPFEPINVSRLSGKVLFLPMA